MNVRLTVPRGRIVVCMIVTSINSLHQRAVRFGDNSSKIAVMSVISASELQI